MSLPLEPKSAVEAAQPDIHTGCSKGYSTAACSGGEANPSGQGDTGSWGQTKWERHPCAVWPYSLLRNGRRSRMPASNRSMGTHPGLRQAV